MKRFTLEETNKKEIRKSKMIEARDDGFSYDDIGRMFGISRQRVHQIIGKENKNLFRPITTKRCVYDGIRNWMNDNKISMAELTRKIYGYGSASQSEKLKFRLIGKLPMSKTIIDEILRITNLTYEEAFKRSNNE